MCSIYVRFKWCVYRHFILHFLVWHLLKHNWYSPYPICIDEEKPIKKLKNRVVRVKLTYFGKHDWESSPSQIPIDLGVYSFVSGPHFQGFQCSLKIFVFWELIFQVNGGSISIEAFELFFTDRHKVDIIKIVNFPVSFPKWEPAEQKIYLHIIEEKFYDRNIGISWDILNKYE